MGRVQVSMVVVKQVVMVEVEVRRVVLVVVLAHVMVVLQAMEQVHQKPSHPARP